MAYKLNLTEADWQTIDFVGGRYGWSEALRSNLSREDGPDFEIPEYIAWAIREGFESDTEGGHSYFPMLDGRSDLADKLYAFMGSIV